MASRTVASALVTLSFSLTVSYRTGLWKHLSSVLTYPTMRSFAKFGFRRTSQFDGHSSANLGTWLSRETFRMRFRHGALFLAGVATLSAYPLRAEEHPGAQDESAVIWSEPTDIASRNLLYGSGGERHMPSGTMEFVDEDHAGTNPKFHVRDQEGTTWTAKLGVEAKPETAASHLLWAAGYFADEDYFVPKLSVKGLPPHLARGQNLVGTDGTIANVRLERHTGRKKSGNWQWKHNPFTATRKFNGLRVMMALMNSWDLKDENNEIYVDDKNSSLPLKIYAVSDLGASFGTTGYSWTGAMGKGNLKSYGHSRFIGKVGTEFVDFNVPTRPALIYFFHLPGLIHRMQMRWIGRHIPREDAKWMGDVLSHLSAAQIQDAFRSAGYSPEEVDGFSKVLEERIAELSKL